VEYRRCHVFSVASRSCRQRAHARARAGGCRGACRRTGQQRRGCAPKSLGCTRMRLTLTANAARVGTDGHGAGNIASWTRTSSSGDEAWRMNDQRSEKTLPMAENLHEQHAHLFLLHLPSHSILNLSNCDRHLTSAPQEARHRRKLKTILKTISRKRRKRAP
jgi:hypothetical protein